MAAWSFYEGNDYARAVAALDRFVELNPASEFVEYAYYLKALSYYEQIVDVERDADMTQLAMKAFEELVRRFPQGTYARDAQLKIDLTRSHLAGKEMAVGRYYLNNQFYSRIAPISYQQLTLITPPIRYLRHCSAAPRHIWHLASLRKECNRSPFTPPTLA